MKTELPPIIVKTSDLIKLLFLKQKNIPKFERHTIWAECCKQAIQILQSLLSVGLVISTDRVDRLKQVSIRIDSLRIFMRIANECNAIDNKSYYLLQEELDEIGKMLGGWLRHIQAK